MTDELFGLRRIGDAASVDFDHPQCPDEIVDIVRTWGHGLLLGLLMTTGPNEDDAGVVADVLGSAYLVDGPGLSPGLLAHRPCPFARCDFGYLLFVDRTYYWLDFTEPVVSRIGTSFGELLDFLSDEIQPPGDGGGWGAPRVFQVTTPDASPEILAALDAGDVAKAASLFDAARPDAVDYYLCCSLLDELAGRPEPWRLRGAALELVERVHAVYRQCAPRSDEYASIALPLLPDTQFRTRVENDAWRVSASSKHDALRILRKTGSAKQVQISVSRDGDVASVIELDVAAVAIGADLTVPFPFPEDEGDLILA